MGFETRYQVSNTGRVRSTQNNHGTHRIQEVKRTIRSKSCLYMYVQLWRKNKPITYAVHRLVALHFIPNPKQKPMVNHIDGNKLNNNAWNLEWCTCSENHKHAYDTGLRDKGACTKRMIGTKFNAKSAFRNVSWDSTRQKWKGSVKHKGKVLEQKRFDTETEAALHVNWIIAAYSLDRPKNVII
jgi:hypothetical protein